MHTVKHVQTESHCAGRDKCLIYTYQEKKNFLPWNFI